MLSTVLINGLRLAVLALVIVLPVQAEQASSYQQALQGYLAESAQNKDPFSADDRATMKKSAQALAQAMPSPGLKVGEKAPDFTLNDAYGKPVNLYQQLQRGRVVLVFYRGSWCPFCNLHLHVLSQHFRKFKDRGAQIIAITPQRPDKSLEQLKKEDFPFSILSDLDSQVMRDYRLYYQLDDDLLAVYRSHGLDIEAFNGNGRNVLPVPGTFVIDTNRTITAMQAETDYTQRMEPEAILQALSW